MCGILVVLSKRHPLNIGQCNSVMLAMKNRGPDWQESSVFMDDRLFLGLTVLRITGGRSQRQDLKDRQYWLLFNGEIYNHAALYNEFLRPHGFSWDSGTDTEVLAKLHEALPPAEVYRQLSGMFAYVIYDRVRDALLVGRDTIGEKYLYQYEDENLLIFSSEIRPILKLVPGLKMDLDTLREYFFTRHLLTSEQTVWQGVRLVPSGELREYSLKEMRWRPTLYQRSLPSLIDPKRIEENRSRSEYSLVDELESVCREVALDLCPKISYASVMSGGVDSSLASFFMADSYHKPEIVALQFPGKDYPSSDRSLDEFESETGWMVKTTKVTEDEYANCADNCYEIACSPIPTHSYISQSILAEFVQSLGHRVLIVGEGGDELFGGYEAYLAFSIYNSVPFANPSDYSGLVPSGVHFEGWSPEALIERQRRQWGLALEEYRHEDHPQDRTVQAALLLDATFQLQSVGIRSADQMSMAHSVEARSFYLHDKIVRFALNLPARHKLSFNGGPFSTKLMLKRLFVRKLGFNLLRPKNGFSGWPNEAGRVLVGSDYSLVRDVLGPFKLSYACQQQWHAAEWKLQNMSLFLQRFKDYA